jgi:hypothetical protein
VRVLYRVESLFRQIEKLEPQRARRTAAEVAEVMAIPDYVKPMR